MHFEQVIIVIVGLMTAFLMSACTMSVTFSPLDTIDNKSAWTDSNKKGGK